MKLIDLIKETDGYDKLIKQEKQESVEMAKVNSTYNASVQRKWGWEKIECVISDIDTELPIEPQLMVCSDALDAVFEMVKEKVMAQFTEIQKLTEEKKTSTSQPVEQPTIKFEV